MTMRWYNINILLLSLHFVASATEGAKSLKDREVEIERISQEKRPSVFALCSAPIKSPQEANAMVLAKWAADENNVVASADGEDLMENPAGNKRALMASGTGKPNTADPDNLNSRITRTRIIRTPR